MIRRGAGVPPARKTRTFGVAALFAVTLAISGGTARVALAQDAPPASAPPPAAAATPDVPQNLTLDDALRLFRARGFDLLLAEAQVKSAEADEYTAGAVPNPGLNGGITLLPGYSTAGCSGGCSGFGFQVGVTDNAAIIGDTLAGKREARKAVAAAALKAAKMSKTDALRVLEFQVKQQYVTVALAKATFDFATEVADSSTQTLELNKLRYPRVIDEGALARIETAKYAADNALDRAKAQVRQTQIDLGFLLGIRGNVPEFQVSSEFAKFAVPTRLTSAAPDGLRREAYDHRPDLKVLGYQKERASNSIELAKRTRFPDIALQAQYSQIGTSSDAVAPPAIFFGFSTPIPLFYQQQGEIKRAEADLMTQTVARQKLEAQVVNDVEGAFNSFTTTRRIMERYDAQYLARAKVARDITKRQYEAGSAPLMDYLDAQRTFIATNLDYLNTLTNYWTAVFQLETAVGMDLRR
jgi:outer membrane protein, heavy metal efflux system